MYKSKRYKFDNETLDCHEMTVPLYGKILKAAVLFVLSVCAFVFYLYLFTNVFGLKTPKTLVVERNLNEWHSKLDMLGLRFDKAEAALADLEMRDNILYRSIFGMEQIPSDVRNAGYGGVDRYSYLRDGGDYSGLLTSAVERIDILYKKAYLQSKSFDQVSIYSERAGEMALCVPTIPPVNMEHVRYASGYGMRLDPVYKDRVRLHAGVDLSPRNGKEGEPVYVTGDGVVERVVRSRYGYGNYVLVDHGFGYKTRYAHLREASVVPGQQVRRGEMIAFMGNTGHSNGTHLHYEVIYMNKTVNPVNYYNQDISPEDYEAIISTGNGGHE